MSAYKDFVFDLPERSLCLLRELEPAAKDRDREVTLLIMVASTAFIFPMERLDSSHPAGDAKRFSDTSSELRKVMGGVFIGSPFFAKGRPPWQHGHVPTFGDGPDSWGYSCLLDQQPVSYVLKIIRNALAHGNLSTWGDPISDLVLYSNRKDTTEYKYLRVTVLEFQRFLVSWFTYVQDKGFKYPEMLVSIAEAA